MIMVSNLLPVVVVVAVVVVVVVMVAVCCCCSELFRFSLLTSEFKGGEPLTVAAAAAVVALYTINHFCLN